MKYFFLSKGWQVGRVWELGGLWNENRWQRKPIIKCLYIGIVEQGETLLLYAVEDQVLMVEVFPDAQTNSFPTIGQVVLKRLMGPEQVIESLSSASELIRARVAELEHDAL
ncbi:MAG: hypothetical protein DSM107014_06855 [Gomphosphaeria aponina SAG 52.96 = DSM 107014]|uniref:Uncharacterized protein n=1 Tax=Gomphosphaeria aponina SAG 52.96 = DSM 107014 TaxID=1521640 RepID=A0A941GXK0_9CHRO|nr:hypothetical protein [Gomphosphaeria aponina SAG 52.96 = DSM 107014]